MEGTVSSRRMKAAGEPMSGFGAPAFTAMPTPEAARSTRVPAASTPFAVSASIPSAVRIAASPASPPAMRARMAAVGS